MDAAEKRGVLIKLLEDALGLADEMEFPFIKGIKSSTLHPGWRGSHGHYRKDARRDDVRLQITHLRENSRDLKSD
jgi:hypothetical protein